MAPVGGGGAPAPAPGARDRDRTGERDRTAERDRKGDRNRERDRTADRGGDRDRDRTADRPERDRTADRPERDRTTDRDTRDRGRSPGDLSGSDNSMRAMRYTSGTGGGTTLSPPTPVAAYPPTNSRDTSSRVKRAASARAPPRENRATSARSPSLPPDTPGPGALPTSRSAPALPGSPSPPPDDVHLLRNFGGFNATSREPGLGGGAYPPPPRARQGAPTTLPGFGGGRPPSPKRGLAGVAGGLGRVFGSRKGSGASVAVSEDGAASGGGGFLGMGRRSSGARGREAQSQTRDATPGTAARMSSVSAVGRTQSRSLPRDARLGGSASGLDSGVSDTEGKEGRIEGEDGASHGTLERVKEARRNAAAASTGREALFRAYEAPVNSDEEGAKPVAKEPKEVPNTPSGKDMALVHPDDDADEEEWGATEILKAAGLPEPRVASQVGVEEDDGEGAAGFDYWLSDHPLTPSKLRHRVRSLLLRIRLERRARDASERALAVLAARPNPTPEDTDRMREVEERGREARRREVALARAVVKYARRWEEAGGTEEGFEDVAEGGEPTGPPPPPPVHGLLHVSVLAAVSLPHRTAGTSLSSSVSLDGAEVHRTARSRAGVWHDPDAQGGRKGQARQGVVVEVEGGREVEVVVRENPSAPGGEPQVVGVAWFALSEVAEVLGARKGLLAERSGSVLADAPGGFSRKASVKGLKGEGATGLEDGGMMVWVEAEPGGQVLLRLNFVPAGSRIRTPSIAGSGSLRRRPSSFKRVLYARGHRFASKVKYQLVRCAVCGELLMGGGVTCEDCQHTVHKHCIERVVSKCFAAQPDENETNPAILQRHRIPHRFAPFFNPPLGGNWCVHCGHLLSLGKADSKRCTECGDTCHERCEPLVPRMCGLSRDDTMRIMVTMEEIEVERSAKRRVLMAKAAQEEELKRQREAAEAEEERARAEEERARRAREAAEAQRVAARAKAEEEKRARWAAERARKAAEETARQIAAAGMAAHQQQMEVLARAARAVGSTGSDDDRRRTRDRSEGERTAWSMLGGNESGREEVEDWETVNAGREGGDERRTKYTAEEDDGAEVPRSPDVDESQEKWKSELVQMKFKLESELGRFSETTVGTASSSFGMDLLAELGLSDSSRPVESTSANGKSGPVTHLSSITAWGDSSDGQSESSMARSG
ncbi:hypothetical protein M427DRAFT_150806 [Gonapodya prolifera JEL478]|uniref:Phorbol-ester/DAG-type domain-containing protein n=1 Tax=Gonapodya prolifera (strain JEL478) TaxID=1344416 RepID=A0A139B0P0_GONPJ|nr:hypothetical protein M427DRAFT_150806 [Gonapodya prolifera JEL478]|eukprot:KXS22561.1 hypothetical protein M427DRAFT_150806 [Gonapodya prolifera JEL478]